MRVLSCIVLATALLTTLSSCRKGGLPDFVTADEKNVMETNQGLPAYGKGGVGIISADLYVNTKSVKNEIMWGYGENSKEWVGRNASKPEVVVFFDGKAWPPQDLPHDFDKSKSVVVSFEEKEICFYDYVHRQGGYYERWPPEERNA